MAVYLMSLVWTVQTARVQPGVAGDIIKLNEILAEHWEPFAVTWGDGCFVYHLRQLNTAGPKAPNIPMRKRGY